MASVAASEISRTCLTGTETMAQSAVILKRSSTMEKTLAKLNWIAPSLTLPAGMFTGAVVISP